MNRGNYWLGSGPNNRSLTVAARITRASLPPPRVCLRTHHPDGTEAIVMGRFALLGLLFGTVTTAHAESLELRNDCGCPIIVQAVSVCRGVFHRDRPYLLPPGAATPRITLPGDKLLTISDARLPTRVLFQTVVPRGSCDRRLHIQPATIADCESPTAPVQ